MDSYGMSKRHNTDSPETCREMCDKRLRGWASCGGSLILPAHHVGKLLHQMRTVGGGSVGCHKLALSLSPIASNAVRDFPVACRDAVKRSLRPGELGFTSHNQLWANASTDCPFRYAGRQQLFHRLRSAAQGRGVLLSGDSMMRQIFLRLIAFFRGDDHLPADHYFHNDAVYLITATGDCLVPLVGNALRGPAAKLIRVMSTFFPGYSGTSLFDGDGASPVIDPSTVLLAILYSWETKPSVYRKEFTSIKPPLHVASFMYWWQNKDKLTDINPYLSAVERHLDSLAKESVVPYFLWVTTPWTAPKIFGGVEPENRIARNQRVTRWLQTAAPRGRTALVDFEAIANSARFPKTRDGIHYQCIWTPKYPELVNGMKENGQDCHDPVNLAVVQWLGHVLDILLHTSLD